LALPAAVVDVAAVEEEEALRRLMVVVFVSVVSVSFSPQGEATILALLLLALGVLLLVVVPRLVATIVLGLCVLYKGYVFIND
jgi:hypothetical protein